MTKCIYIYTWLLLCTCNEYNMCRDADLEGLENLMCNELGMSTDYTYI